LDEQQSGGKHRDRAPVSTSEKKPALPGAGLLGIERIDVNARVDREHRGSAPDRVNRVLRVLVLGPVAAQRLGQAGVCSPGVGDRTFAGLHGSILDDFGGYREQDRHGSTLVGDDVLGALLPYPPEDLRSLLAKLTNSDQGHSYKR